MTTKKHQATRTTRKSQTSWRGPTMPIDAPSGSVVLYHGTSDAQVQWGGCSDPRPLLKRRKRYTVERTEIHSWHTKVYLHEVRGAFPSGAFHLAKPSRQSPTITSPTGGRQ